MGDFKFTTANSLGNASAPIEFTADSSAITTSSSAFYTPAKSVPTSHLTMQNELNAETTTVSSIISSDKITTNAIVNNNNNGSSQPNKEQINSNTNEKVSQSDPSLNVQISLPYTSESNLNASSNASGGSLWSTPEEQHMPMNGISFQNFQSGGLFNGSLGINSAQRRPVTGTQSYQHPVGRGLSVQQHNAFKSGYPTWSNPQPSAWPSGQNQNVLASWNRGRSVPNLNPMAALAARKPAPGPAAYLQHPVISPVKFRRSTSYPGKVPGFHQQPQQAPFESTVLDDMMPYQVNIIFNNCIMYTRSRVKHNCVYV